MNKLTLAEDFEMWWDMPKYRNHDIPAKEFGNQTVTYKHGSNRGWPGEERDVDYWVELDNGFAVGMRHGRSDSGMRRAKYAEFPVVKMSKSVDKLRYM